MIVNLRVITGCTKSARFVEDMGNDEFLSRLLLVSATQVELGVLGASVWSRREPLGYVG